MLSTNHQLANLLITMGELLSTQGANPHRVRAYKRAAETIVQLNEDVTAIANRGDLQELTGIGKDLSTKIVEFIQTGTIRSYQELTTPLPEHVQSWVELPGFTEPIVNDLYFRLGIQTLDDLESLVRSHILRTRPGMTATTEELLAAVHSLRQR
ncbi:MAG: histidinol-phosphatase [Nitrospirota bacterium]|nr:histidinol-phosphatase [Nitrospirota bacterium]